RRAKGSTDALMSEAHPERRNAITAERPDRLAGHACLAWITRARRHDHAVRTQRAQRLDRDLVIASHDDVGPERSGELDEVVRKGVVVVDHEHSHARRSETVTCEQGGV